MFSRGHPATLASHEWPVLLNCRLGCGPDCRRRRER